MVSYKELGLVNTREMFAKAVKGGYAIPAFNFNNMEQLQAIIKASAETKSPVILQVSKGARNYANQTLLRYMAQGAVEYAKELGWENPQICLHLNNPCRGIRRKGQFCSRLSLFRRSETADEQSGAHDAQREGSVRAHQHQQTQCGT